jgi:hypothetical protein
MAGIIRNRGVDGSNGGGNRTHVVKAMRHRHFHLNCGNKIGGDIVEWLEEQRAVESRTVLD